MNGAKGFEQPAAGMEYREEGKAYEDSGSCPPIPHKQPVFVDHLFCLPGFAEQNCHNALTDGYIRRIDFCEVVPDVVLQGWNRGEGVWLSSVHS